VNFHTPNKLRDAMPWIIVFILVLLAIAFFGWLGFDNWSDTVP
jgi:Mg2+ and Co2+ transporter CorA